MLEQLEHMKRWAQQDQSALTKEQLCKGFVQMCDDALRELCYSATTTVGRGDGYDFTDLDQNSWLLSQVN